MVDLGDDARVQNVGEVLNQVQPAEQVKIQRRSRRLDYVTFHKYGHKETKNEGQEGNRK